MSQLIMTAASHADEAIGPRSAPKVQEIPKRKWASYIWDTFDKSPEERRLLFKLDTAILTFASLGRPSKLVNLPLDQKNC
jgi:hypothetical protein